MRKALLNGRGRPLDNALLNGRGRPLDDGGQGSSGLFLRLEFEDALSPVGIHHVIDFSAFIFTEC